MALGVIKNNFPQIIFVPFYFMNKKKDGIKKGKYV